MLKRSLWMRRHSVGCWMRIRWLLTSSLRVFVSLLRILANWKNYSKSIWARLSEIFNDLSYWYILDANCKQEKNKALLLYVSSCILGERVGENHDDNSGSCLVNDKHLLICILNICSALYDERCYSFWNIYVFFTGPQMFFLHLLVYCFI